MQLCNREMIIKQESFGVRPFWVPGLSVGGGGSWGRKAEAWPRAEGPKGQRRHRGAGPRGVSRKSSGWGGGAATATQVCGLEGFQLCAASQNKQRGAHESKKKCDTSYGGRVCKNQAPSCREKKGPSRAAYVYLLSVLFKQPGKSHRCISSELSKSWAFSAYVNLSHFYLTEVLYLPCFCKI